MFSRNANQKATDCLVKLLSLLESCERDGLHGTMTVTKTEPLNVIYGLGVEELDKEGRVLTIELPTLFVVNCYAPRAVNLERHDFTQCKE